MTCHMITQQTYFIALVNKYKEEVKARHDRGSQVDVLLEARVQCRKTKFKIIMRMMQERVKVRVSRIMQERVKVRVSSGLQYILSLDNNCN